VAALTGLSDEFGVAVELTVVERLEGLALLPVPLGILWASTPANASRPARLAGRNALLRTTAYH